MRSQHIRMSMDDYLHLRPRLGWKCEYWSGRAHFTPRLVAVDAVVDVLFMVPEWRRRGVATALVAAALDRLHEAGVVRLASRYFLGNDTSRAWHLAFGFVEVPDWLTSRLLWRHAVNDLSWLEEAGDLGATERAARAAEIDALAQRVEALDPVRGASMPLHSAGSQSGG